MAENKINGTFDKLIDISLPEKELKELENLDVLANGSRNDSTLNVSYATNASLNRAVYWISLKNCATITAWRSENTRAVNNANNRKLQETLCAMGYGVIKLQGFYAEMGHDVSKENSFLVFDKNDDPDFYANLRTLSEKYDQDCFLFKAVDEDVAYLIGTNEDFIKTKGERIEAGRLRIGNLSAETFSKIGSGIISFE